MLKLGFLLAVVLGVLLPLSSWGERKHLAWLEGRVGPSPDALGVRAGGLLHPLAEGLRGLANEWDASRGDGTLRTLGPVLVFTSALLAWSIVPFGGTYAFGETTVSLAVADVDWGFLLVAVAVSLAGVGALLAGTTPLAAGRAAGFSLVGGASVGFALLALALANETLRPAEIVAAQDATFPPIRWLAGLSDAAAHPPWHSWLRFPTWGIVLQPLGFLAFAGGLALLLGAVRGDPTVRDARHGLLEIAQRIWLVGAAAWITTLYLGGWAIPFLPTQTLISFVASGFGTGFATGFVLLLHVATFFAKVVVVLAGLLIVTGSQPQPRPDQAMAIGTGLVLPLATLNLLLASVAVGAFGGAPG